MVFLPLVISLNMLPQDYPRTIFLIIGFVLKAMSNFILGHFNRRNRFDYRRNLTAGQLHAGIYLSKSSVIKAAVQNALVDIPILISDILAVSIMGGIGISGTKYFAYLLREDDLKNLRYIWVPNMISGGFFLALVLALFINDVFGTYRSPFYLEVHLFLLVGSAFFGLSIYRFIKTIKSHIESKKKAEASLTQIQSELTTRLQVGRSEAYASQEPTPQGQKSGRLRDSKEQELSSHSTNYETQKF